MRIASDDFAFGIDNDKGIRHGAEQAIQFFLGPGAAMRCAQEASSANERQSAGKSDPRDAEHRHALAGCCHPTLFLLEATAVFFLENSQRNLDLFIQVVPFVGEVGRTKSPKEIFIPEL